MQSGVINEILLDILIVFFIFASHFHVFLEKQKSAAKSVPLLTCYNTFLLHQYLFKMLKCKWCLRPNRGWKWELTKQNHYHNFQIHSFRATSNNKQQNNLGLFRDHLATCQPFGPGKCAWREKEPIKQAKSTTLSIIYQRAPVWLWSLLKCSNNKELSVSFWIMAHFQQSPGTIMIKGECFVLNHLNWISSLKGTIITMVVDLF